jgi:hypothetical protein
METVESQESSSPAAAATSAKVTQEEKGMETSDVVKDSDAVDVETEDKEKSGCDEAKMEDP